MAVCWPLTLELMAGHGRPSLCPLACSRLCDAISMPGWPLWRFVLGILHDGSCSGLSYTVPCLPGTRFPIFSCSCAVQVPQEGLPAPHHACCPSSCARAHMLLGCHVARCCCHWQVSDLLCAMPCPANTLWSASGTHWWQRVVQCHKVTGCT